MVLTQDDECPTCGQCYSPYESEDIPNPKGEDSCPD